MGSFEVFLGKDGKYYFRLKAGNHRVIAVSEGYERKEDALGGIEAVRDNAVTWDFQMGRLRQLLRRRRSVVLDRFEVFADGKGRHQFRLKSPNGEVVASSQAYRSLAGALAGIGAVRRNAPLAEIRDLTG